MQPIVITTRIYYPEKGAAAYRLRAVAQEIAKHRPVRVLTGKLRGNEDGKSPDTHVAIKRWPVLRDAEGFVRGAIQFASFDAPLLLRLLFGRQFAAAISEPPPTTGTMVRLACTIRRRPYLYYSADVATDAVAGMTSAPIRRLVARLEKFALSGAAAVIAVNEQVGQRVKELGAKNVHVVQNGVDTNTFTPEISPLSPAELEAAGIDRPYFIYTGTASKWQGAELFARALTNTPELANYQLIFFSQGDSQPQIDELAANSNGQVLTHKLVPPAEAARWIAGAQAAVVSIVPGQGYDYAYPTKLYASWACATPVIYAGTGPAADDIREHKLGIVCDYSQEAIADAMRECVQSKPNRPALRKWVVENRSLRLSGRQVARIAETIISRNDH